MEGFWVFCVLVMVDGCLSSFGLGRVKVVWYYVVMSRVWCGWGWWMLGGVVVLVLCVFVCGELLWLLVMFIEISVLMF